MKKKLAGLFQVKRILTCYPSVSLEKKIVLRPWNRRGQDNGSQVVGMEDKIMPGGL